MSSTLEIFSFGIGEKKGNKSTLCEGAVEVNYKHCFLNIVDDIMIPLIRESKMNIWNAKMFALMIDVQYIWGERLKT